jgi:hypothetical protein
VPLLPMKPAMKFNPSRFQKSLAELRRHSKLDSQSFMRQRARSLLRRIVDITPPATGKANSKARIAGEAAIAGDLLKLAVPAVAAAAKKSKGAFDDVSTLAAAHAASRGRGGRVNPRNRKLLFVKQAEFQRLLKQLQSFVGILAAGWNAAAQRLGIRLPAWIARHGTRHGSIQIHENSSGIRIVLRNSVPFVDDVTGLKRRVNAAMDYEANSIKRQVKHLVRKAAAKAGFRIR